MTFKLGGWYTQNPNYMHGGNTQTHYLCVFVNRTHAALEVYRPENKGEASGLTNVKHEAVTTMALFGSSYKEASVPEWCMREYIPTQEGDRDDDI